jgi:hypothetical protein
VTEVGGSIVQMLATAEPFCGKSKLMSMKTFHISSSFVFSNVHVSHSVVMVMRFGCLMTIRLSTKTNVLE